jgi:Zn-dependent peptidase ImmA (M78 family)
MIAREHALILAEQHFPSGPEELAKRLGARVERSQLVGCDGWCIRSGSNLLIRLNSRSSSARQRFTLAHELSHLISGTSPHILRSWPTSAEGEKLIDSLAAELLLPSSHLKSLVGSSLPLDAKCVRRLAKSANVSETMAGCRVATLANDLGLINAAVTAFDEDNTLLWTWAPNLKVPEAAALKLLELAEEAAPNPHRYTQNGENVVVASLLGGQSFRVLFMQLLPSALANQKSEGERLRELDHLLFGGDRSLRGRVSGSLGAFKNKYPAKTLGIPQSIRLFGVSYIAKWQEPLKSKMLTPQGQEYLALHLKRWCKE